MATSHSVDFLSSGFVIKTASSGTFNDKLKAEIAQINALHGIYPDLMVPVLHHGAAAGRHFYILEKKAGLPLSKIVFDTNRPIENRRSIVRTALDGIHKAIEIEYGGQNSIVNDMHSRLTEEWEAVSYMRDLFDKPILFDGCPLKLTGTQVIEKAIAFSESETFASVDKAHFNFHFGNVLFDESSNQVNFIDPDHSVRGIDPTFGFSRFAFSFWHELATEASDAVKILPVTDAVLFVLRLDEHRQILRGIPELRGISGLSAWVGEAKARRFYALTAYCFLRSIRINGTRKPWSTPHVPTLALPEEVLMLGMLLYLEGANDNHVASFPEHADNIRHR